MRNSPDNIGAGIKIDESRIVAAERARDIDIAIGIKNRRRALIAAVIVPSAVSLLLTFGLHSLKGTPKPLASTIPTAIFVIPSTAVWGYRKRKQFETQKTVKF